MVDRRITILMPVYNAATFLREAIDSILNQSFPFFEFLIIDDGSTDDSADIINSYDDDRIIFYQNERNLGISATLNKGIELASCELIARMDADDISYPDRLAKQYQFMSANPECAMVSSWAKVVTEDRRLVRLEKYRSPYYYFNLTFECWIYHPTVMFRKAAVTSIGMYSMPYSEDYDLFWKLSTQFHIANIPEALVEYRLSGTSLNTVLKKEEYDIANEENVLRNIRYYMGDDFHISKPALECLRHNFGPIVRRNDLRDIFETLGILDRITEKILERDNPNRDVQAINEARFYKRQFIISELGKELPTLRAVLLLARTNSWATLYSISLNFMRWKLKKIKSLLLNISL